MDLGLQGKVAVVTGSSKGIGLATAKMLVGEGADVTICARNLDRLEAAKAEILAETGKEVLVVVADMTIEADCERVIEETVEHFGRLDILINNAGTSEAHPFEEVDNALWQKDLDLKLFGAINTTRAAVPHMRQVGGGAVVNLTAAAGKTPGAKSFPTSISRAAGLALTKGLSKEFAADNIRINAVCIGLIRSDQIEKKWQNERPDLTWEEYSALDSHEIPMGRIGDTVEAAKVITFLASSGASYVTGTSVNIDGGKVAVL
ncbi:SDR family NAD(P)-dependent oxidoreductase [Fundicoccus culcitae]|uniref:SDR family oxidoreductase n=1 Tax=Fundicoccus culcitae TaxID=2969821 RepID=A0ABY5P2W1_9LACT|nr:SDR family oxidoreductase [Fundicoccus culcitae]UUX32760.1 SDR family oxidoreductase [Fundicoccus culcitae]